MVIYLSPLAPSWIKNLADTAELAIEKHFAEVISKAIAPYPNMHLLDFQPLAVPGLDDSKFADGTHLNKDGAPIFTAYLVDTLRRQKIIK